MGHDLEGYFFNEKMYISDNVGLTLNSYGS